MKKLSLILMCVIVTTASLASAWGPNDPTDANADPDGDKLGNLDEYLHGSNPMIPDTDGGGCPDGWEVMYGFLPTYAKDDSWDVDNDGWSNIREYLEGTNPLHPNTDRDCFPLDSTDPHPLIPDGYQESQGETWWDKGDGKPPEDSDRDGLVDFIEGL
jgi:hypothetical protein